MEWDQLRPYIISVANNVKVVTEAYRKMEADPATPVARKLEYLRLADRASARFAILMRMATGTGKEIQLEEKKRRAFAPGTPVIANS